MNIIIKTLALPSLLLGGVLLIGGEAAAQVDFNMNTIQTDLRSDGSNNNPGFGPCSGGTRSATGTCTLPSGGAITALLDPDALQTLFPSLGPGAVTDNMFGIISGADATPVGSGGPIPTTSCGKITNASLAGLNCGDLRFDPASQGQSTLTTDANTLVTPSPLTMNNQLIADFCNGSGTDCDPDGAGPLTRVTAAHVGFNFANNFSFQVVNGTSSTTSGATNMLQVTAVKASGIGLGTKAGAGTGDQVVEVNASWTGGTSSNNPAVGPAGLSIAWSQFLSDPDQSGTGSGAFTQDIAGTFSYNANLGVISAQYPSGQTQTQRSAGLTVGAETLSFGP